VAAVEAKGANEAGVRKILPVAAGFTVRPFTKVSVQPVVLLKKITDKGVGAGAVPPAAHVVWTSGIVSGTMTTKVVVPSAFTIVDCGETAVVPIVRRGAPIALATVMLTVDPGLTLLGVTATMLAFGTRKMKLPIEVAVSCAEILVTITGAGGRSEQLVGTIPDVTAIILVPLTERT